MLYKEDWDQAKERFKALWKRELIDRCCVSVLSPRKGCKKVTNVIPSDPDERLRYWTDGETILKRKIEQFENTYFGGEAFPLIFPDLGAAGHAGFFKGASFQFENTVWFFPVIKDLYQDPIEFDPDSFLYKKTMELVKYFAGESKGRYFISMPDIGGNADALAHLRGSENLLMDLYDDGDKVREILSGIQPVWESTLTTIYDIVKETNEGGSVIGWMNLWAPGKHAQMQCDLSAMISPDMYRTFAVPELRAQIDWMDHSTYHFDGIEQIRHLDLILSLEKLDLIQWTPVEGQPSPVNFIPEMKRIQAAGKCLLLMLKPREIEPIMRELSSKGLYILTEADTEDEAGEIIKTVGKLTHE